jgi:hypothetical protein
MVVRRFKMENCVYKIIENQNKKVIETADLLFVAERQFGGEVFELKGGYRAFAAVIDGFCEKGLISPVKASGINSRNPSLYNKYRVLINTKKQLCEEHMQELQSLHPKLDKGFYFKNPDEYRKDRDYVLMLSDYLLDSNQNNTLKYRCTMNERSFEIFNNEKLLESKGKVLLKRLGLSLEGLNCYKTHEAFFYILFEPKERLNVLIVENKDTFYSALKYLERKLDREMYGVKVDMLIYGEGKKIVKSFSFISEVSMGTPIDRVYYFGDLDFEGIGIYNSLASKYGKHLIVPHTALYKEMLFSVKKPPVLRTGQTEFFLDLFLMYFDEESKDRILKILYNGQYIPQEAVNFGRKKSC